MIYNQDKFDSAKPAGFDGIFVWDYLKKAFYPTKIQPMDFDAVVERNGCFLVFETKTPGVEIPLGQRLTLEMFVRQG
jgi:hypothetical protein